MVVCEKQLLKVEIKNLKKIMKQTKQANYISFAREGNMYSFCFNIPNGKIGKYSSRQNVILDYDLFNNCIKKS